MKIIIISIIRTIVSYILLLIVTRLIGRKSISQMTFFDFSIAITLGAVAANIGSGGDNSLTSSITELLTLGVLGLLTGIIHIHSTRIRKLINSEPVVLISNGELVKTNMKKIRLTINELTSLLREKNYFNIADVHYAILENDGKLSVLPKSDKKPLTPFDMQMHPPESGLTKDIIIDGNILYENLEHTNLTEKWLFNELKRKGFTDAKEVFFAALDSSGQLYVSKGIEGQEQHGQYGIE